MPNIRGSRPPAARALRGALIGLAIVLAATVLITRAGPIPSVGTATGASPSTASTAAGTPGASPTPGPVAFETPSLTPSPRSSAGTSASPSPAGPFAMDLYHPGEYVGELRKVWCLPAAMQTSMNIMDAGADRSEKTQARIFALARKLAPAPDGAAEPEGWARGLTRLGYGGYMVTQEGSIAAAIHLVARQVRLTNRPAGLLVWRGAHSWVVSGFTATADPARTSSYVVTAVRIEDVWYPRFSTIWGYSRPPDALVPVAGLRADYLPWKRPSGRYPGKDGMFVVVIPTA